MEVTVFFRRGKRLKMKKSKSYAFLLFELHKCTEGLFQQTVIKVCSRAYGNAADMVLHPMRSRA